MQNLSTAERLALLKLARATATAQAAETLSPIEPADRSGPLPLSFAQQRMWFLEQLGDAGPAHHIPTRVRLKGALHREALVRALDRIVARHEALRTTFPAVDGSPVQRIIPAEEARFHLVEHDLSEDAAPEAELRRMMAKEAVAPFDLARGPLVRGRLIRRAQDDHVLLVTMHHIVSDGWSMGVFTRELGDLYGAFQRGEPDPLPPLPVQYADYAAWQRQRVEGEVLKAQADYWKKTLGGAPELLELPTDYPRPAQQDYAGGSVGVELDEGLTAGLRALSQRHGTTLFMTLLAGWAVVLGRLSGQEDVVIGTPMAGRGRREIEGLIGFFVNTLAIRVDLSGAPTVAEALGRVKERVLGAQSHQDIPFEQVVELLDPARSLAHHPLFQVMFAWQSAGKGGGVALPGLDVGGVGGSAGGGGSGGAGAGGPAARVQAQFDLSLTLREAGDRIVGDLTYATALFDRTTVERYVGYLRQVLEGMVADEGRRVGRLTLLPEAERRQVVEEWNDTARDYPRERTLHELFAERAALTPEAPAAIAHDGTLSWAALEARAASLAALLRARGIGPESCVGVLLERCADTAVALLAILRAGAAWLPLDPNYPRERLGWMLNDAGARLVLAHTPTLDRIPDDAPETLRMDGGWEALAPPPLPLDASGAGPDHLAYVIYTSGSTGRPKGVAVSHRAAVNFATDMAERLGLGTDDRVLQFASPGFDVVVEEIFPAWLAGSAVVFSDADLLSPRELTAELARREVTAVELPTAYWHEWVREMSAGELQAPPSLRQVWVGGERASPERLREWTSSGMALVHVFGLTETACTSATLRLEPGEDGSRWANLPIGRATGNARLYVLDGEMQPVPVGVPGELYVGGDGVGRGYLGRPELTASRFVPDPFSGSGARLYRTGDRARWIGDGLMEFIGRIDYQAKIRGFRIEPGEVEARLLEHPAVREAAVIVREDAPGAKRLVAYVVGEEPMGADVLRAHLGERLPEYMVPAAYVRLDALPFSPNGKVNRRALPAPEGDAFATRGYEAPEGETERVLAGVWAEVLGVERVGRRDHFFELGGHSLLAVQAISRVRQALGVDVALGDVFVHPVLADFARGVETASRAEQHPILPAEPAERTALSFAQQRLWFLEQLGGTGRAYHMPTGQRLRGPLDRDALVRALDRIVARHEVLRTTFAAVDGVPSQRIAPAGEARFHLVEHDLRGAADAGAELRRLTADETGAPFDLERGPLVRGRLIRIADEDHVLLVTMHHIVSDGWSMGVFTRELGALYAAFRDGGTDPLPPLPVQYADYAAWQRRWVDGDVLRAQADYWRETLAGAPARLELPADHVRPAVQDHAGAVVNLELDEALASGVRALARRHGTTMFMTLLAGWATVLGRLSGQEDVVIGTPTANRGRREIEGLIGFFVNTLALRVDLSGAPSAAEVLARVKDRALGAQHHQDIPFEQVVEVVQPVRSLSHTPLFQVMFTWEDGPAGEMELPGLARVHGRAPSGSAASPRSPSQATAKFDLSLTLFERGGRIGGNVEYATALFERETIERHVGYLRRVLEGMVADDRRSVARIPLLSDEERRTVVETWSRAGSADPGEGGLHAWFEAHARRAPGAVAVVDDGRSLSYGELNARANRLARHLVALGVRPEQRVAVCGGRSPELVAALLAVLKAGGAYVPVDPALPDGRLRHLLDDCAPVAVLAEAATAARFASASIPVVRMDYDAAWAGEPADDLARMASPEQAAYVIYTSGSTGTPKGVVVAHHSARQQMAALQAELGLRADDRFLHFASFTFDASVEEIFGALCSGAALVLRSDAWLEGAPAFWARCEREGVTICDLPTRFWQILAADEDAPIPPSVRLLVIGGEAADAAAMEAWSRRGGHRPRLVNSYGPTEATVNATLREVDDDPAGWRSIGRPIAGTRAYLADAHGEPVPVGVVGEILLGGGQVARGYLHRPALTAERFVPDPFGGEPGARLYRTGDLGRWRDGEIDFAGRADFQVKVRGFRIELGEIEAALAAHPGVQAAAVLALDGASGGRRLVAYHAGDALGADALRIHLAERLPEYMIPAAYVQLDALPLTPGGKVDRRALPAPEGDDLAGVGYEAPEGETEEAVAGIWAEVLGVERVGRRDNFFERGGHSLLAVQVVARVRKALGAEVALGHVFSHPTVESFAARLRGEAEGARNDGAIAIRRTGTQPPLFLVYEGAGSTAYAQVLHPHIDGDIPVYALPVPPSTEAPLRTVEGMATLLARMIQAVQPSGPYRVAGWSFGGVLAYEVAVQLIGQDETVAFVGLLDSYHPADAGPASDDAASDHAHLLHVLRMADAAAGDGRAAGDEETGAPADADLERFVARCHEKGLLPDHVTVAHAREMRDRLRNHGQALWDYVPQPIPVDVHLFPARENRTPDPSREWRALLPERSLRVTPVPGTHLSMMSAPNVRSLGEALSARIREAGEGSKGAADDGYSPLLKLQGGKPGVAPLFCVPGAGTSVTTFIDLLGCVDPSWPVHGLQPRGMDGASVPHSTVAAAAEHYLRAIREECPEGPVHLLGHSFGGWVAFEMALRLRAAGRPVASLTILDSEVPESQARSNDYDSRSAFLKLVEILELSAERSFEISPAEVAARDEAGRLRLLHQKMVRYGLLSARSTYEALYGPFRTFSRCLRTTFRPSGVWTDPLRLVLVRDPRMDETANLAMFADVVWGWRRWAPGLVFSAGAGNHITALKMPHVAMLARFLAEDRG